MDLLIDINAYPVREVLGILLQDKTTKQNIIWATDEYTYLGEGFGDKDKITKASLFGVNAVMLQPRIRKTLEEQQARTRKKAEVMTPVWLCNKMNNYADEEWFGRKDVFNHENEDHTWSSVTEKIDFNGTLGWKKYIDSRRLEITCGEAPYLVSRYDTTTGKEIVDLLARVGMLDRKLRVVNENTDSEKDWLFWAERAVESCYGYEWQGDNLLIARINILTTFVEYFKERFQKELENKDLKHIAHIICWNLWQMDGLKDTVPLGKPCEEKEGPDLYDVFPIAMFVDQNKEQELEVPYCKIQNWRSKETIEFRKCKETGNNERKNV